MMVSVKETTSQALELSSKALLASLCASQTTALVLHSQKHRLAVENNP